MNTYIYTTNTTVTKRANDNSRVIKSRGINGFLISTTVYISPFFTQYNEVFVTGYIKYTRCFMHEDDCVRQNRKRCLAVDLPIFFNSWKNAITHILYLTYTRKKRQTHTWVLAGVLATLPYYKSESKEGGWVCHNANGCLLILGRHEKNTDQFLLNFCPWTPKFNTFDPKFGFYAKNPSRNRLEMSRIRNLSPKMPKFMV